MQQGTAHDGNERQIIVIDGYASYEWLQVRQQQVDFMLEIT